MGRTGLTGRGLLGKWGPNHAGDPIVTRSITFKVTCSSKLSFYLYRCNQCYMQHCFDKMLSEIQRL